LLASEFFSSFVVEAAWVVEFQWASKFQEVLTKENTALCKSRNCCDVSFLYSSLR